MISPIRSGDGVFRITNFAAPYGCSSSVSDNVIRLFAYCSIVMNRVIQWDDVGKLNSARCELVANLYVLMCFASKLSRSKMRVYGSRTL